MSDVRVLGPLSLLRPIARTLRSARMGLSQTTDGARENLTKHGQEALAFIADRCAIETSL